ncbi:MAG TPA: EAL domain-containing protein [Steroidobacteraceae bacterium]|nr:EAL domain-containing protein [Steroidobacteraceae bacterium]
MARILIVDDDLDVRRMLRLVLQRSGHETDEAEDGTEGLRKAVSGTYDAAVVDYQMPPPDGLELLGRLRDLQPRCVRILTSGALDLPVVMNAINRGEVSRVVEKPFSRQTILEAIDESVAARVRLEELCIGARTDLFGVQRRHLEECLGGGVLQLALQPIVATIDRRVYGFEALLRSSHPVLDTPTRVIAAAEAHDMLGRVADRVAQCAAGALRTLPEEATLFINVHPGELSDAAAVRQRYVRLQPWARRVVLEITERSYVLENDTWRGSVDSLIAAGFRIAVDDLGSGYNSLSVLAALRPHFMKVDRSIVEQIERDDRKQRLVELLVLFAKATGTQLVVEGIETEAEAGVVTRMGADLLQGFLYGRPACSQPVLDS